MPPMSHDTHAPALDCWARTAHAASENPFGIPRLLDLGSPQTPSWGPSCPLPLSRCTVWASLSPSRKWGESLKVHLPGAKEPNLPFHGRSLPPLPAFLPTAGTGYLLRGRPSLCRQGLCPPSKEPAVSPPPRRSCGPPASSWDRHWAWLWPLPPCAPGSPVSRPFLAAQAPALKHLPV